MISRIASASKNHLNFNFNSNFTFSQHHSTQTFKSCVAGKSRYYSVSKVEEGSSNTKAKDAGAGTSIGADSELYKADHLVVGAGVVGLAVARSLAVKGGRNSSVLLVEKNDSFGQETSSRNSGVIHAGMYYPENFLKSNLCIEGKDMLYDYLEKRNLPHSRIGKWIVAPKSKLKHSSNSSSSSRSGADFSQELVNDNEYLHKLHAKSVGLGIPTHFLSSDEFCRNDMSRILDAGSVLVSPTTGILGQHEYMQSLLSEAEAAGAEYYSRTKVDDIEPLGHPSSGGGFLVRLSTEGTVFDVHAQTVINCAGLYADTISNMVGTKVISGGLPKAGTGLEPGSAPDAGIIKELHFFKGSYYTYVFDSSSSGSSGSYSNNQNLGKLIDKLIYPIPHMSLNSLGIHLTKTVDGRMMFGPDLEPIYPKNSNTRSDFSVNTNNLDVFLDQIRVYLPSIEKNNLQIDYCGIRPKLHSSEKVYSDFVIEKTFEPYGISGFVNLLGIESPGLTSSLAIAEHVKKMLY